MLEGSGRGDSKRLHTNRSDGLSAPCGVDVHDLGQGWTLPGPGFHRSAAAGRDAHHERGHILFACGGESARSPSPCTSKSVYVLPVPMGSPDAYYGVGSYSVNLAGSAGSPCQAYFTSVTPTTWAIHSEHKTHGPPASPQLCCDGPNEHVSGRQPAGTIVSSISRPIPRLEDQRGRRVLQCHGDSLAAATCTVKAKMSWNSGSTYSNNSLGAKTTATACRRAFLSPSRRLLV